MNAETASPSLRATVPDATTRSAAARYAAAGAVAAAAALATGELLAGLLPDVPSLVASVGQWVIDLQPPGAKDFVVALFGTNDKLALEIFIVAVSLGVGAVLGIVSRSWFRAAALAFVAFGVVGFFAASRGALASPVLASVAAALAAGAGIVVLAWLTGQLAAAIDGASQAQMPSWSRRGFLVRAGALAAASVAAGTIGRQLLLARERAVTELPIPAASTVAGLPAGSDFGLPGLTPIVVPNDNFYRIDTALIAPNVDVETWTLRIHGMVERPVTLTYEELVALPLIEQFVTIACVSNQVGGDLVGNAKWTGVRLRDVLAMAGVQPGASQLVGRSVDGWTAGMPTAWVMDPSREPMIAVQMNEQPLPRLHGYPARLIIPGLYGYVSATKWLSELELTTMEAFDGYWVPLGWAKEAPILTQSRIDVPGRGARVQAGRQAIAGVAWAPDRGISRVEVQVDGGEFREATLSTPISDATWVQWRLDWDAQPGDHTLVVRATDGNGELQSIERTRPDPDGARGWHIRAVTVV
jgi:DMSO/TMAO reductase YedYZ molybdopterin-dependent catalytic subunit